MRRLAAVFWLGPCLLPAQAPNGNTDAAAFTSIAQREVAQLHDGITLEQWMATRGKAEHWERKDPEIVPTESHPECLSLVKIETLPSSTTRIVRALYFYPPRAPSRVMFPTSSGRELINTCTLGSLRVEANASTPDAGRRLEEAARKVFAKQYGANTIIHESVFWVPAYYEGSAHWRHGSDLVLGYDTKPGLNDDAPGQLLKGPVAFVGERLPFVRGIQEEYCCARKDYHYRPIESENFHRAIALTGAGAALSARFARLYDEAVQRPESTQWRESLLPALREWLGVVNALANERRAAGLLAADLLLEAAEDAGSVPGWPEQPDLRSELQELGATFELNEFEGDYLYAGNWAKQAGQLDPNGAIGEMALIGSIVRSKCYTAATEFFREVIRDGEGLLARSLDPHSAAQVHFMVGDAYSDIVAIAGGDDGPNGEYDPEQYRNEAGVDREKALQHYRAGLAVDNSSLNAKDAWGQAWRLAAGLLPSHRYVCYGD